MSAQPEYTDMDGNEIVPTECLAPGDRYLLNGREYIFHNEDWDEEDRDEMYVPESLDEVPEFESPLEFCEYYGLNTTDRAAENDDSLTDITNYLEFEHEVFIVCGFRFIKGRIEKPIPVGFLGEYSIFQRQ